MNSNFSFFDADWPLFAKLGKQIEQNIFKDPNISLVKGRQLAEQMTEAVFSLERIDILKLHRQVDRLRELEYLGVMDLSIVDIFHTIRKIGNKATHSNYGNESEAMTMLRRIFFISNWFMEVYGPEGFKSSEFIEPHDIEKITQEEIAKLRAQIELAESEKKDFQERLERISNQQSDISWELIRRKRRTSSKKYILNADYNEKQTRIIFIDNQLRNAGWEADSENLVWGQGARPEKNKNKAIAEFPTDAGNADYALFIGLKLVGIVEAKKYSKPISGDLVQAKDYSKEVRSSSEYQFETYEDNHHAPFIYSSNGRPYFKQLAEQSGIWFWDSRTPDKRSYVLEAWHSPEDLLQKLIVNEAKAEAELKAEPYPAFANRYYQIEAVKAVEKGLEDKQRRMLLAMATGTGKTRLALSIMYRLIKTKRVRRILFLVDRKSLGIQAADALKDIKIDNLSLSDIYDVKEVGDISPDQSTKIHIATVQGMVRRLFYPADDAYKPSVGTYDFIIVDEAHRGYTEDREMSEEELIYQNEQDYVSQYRRVVDYFDATVVGLTATPALHTTEIFGSPIYTYTYADAVIDGYLVDHEPAYEFETELSKHGIKFEAESEVDVWNDETKTIDKAYLEDELDFNVEQFNKKVITESFNRVIAEALTGYIDPTDSESGKTLIFAANDQHADLIVRLLKEAYAEDGVSISDDAIEKITGYIRHVDKAIKRFKNEKNPNIVVTVDLLTTGIDVPEISNLVFLRRVRSRILYDQMLGRATRLCPDIGKESFRIFDAVHLYNHLQKVTDMKPVVSSPKLSIKEVLEKALLAVDNDEFEFFKSELIAKIQRKKQRIRKEDKEELAKLLKTADLDFWIQNMKNLNQKEIEEQEENIMLVATWYTFQDPTIISVHKDSLIDVTRGYGDENVKPGDYLNEFNQFIQENINLIPALQVVVSRPKELTYEDLRNIQLQLKIKKFDEKSLQEAWRQEKKEYIAADIISFIRQAALGTELVDHETRIKKAMQKVYGMESWNPKQMKWLQRIEKQLLKTPVLAPTAKQYFDDTDVWRSQGGYKFAQKQIGANIDDVIRVLNDELYAG